MHKAVGLSDLFEVVNMPLILELMKFKLMKMKIDVYPETCE